MRSKLIKLLRCLEEESGFYNKYADSFGEPQCDYEVKEYIDFPNYWLVVRRYNEKYPLPKHNGLQPITLDNGIKAELKRMEMDGLIMNHKISAEIVIQKNNRQFFPSSKSRTMKKKELYLYLSNCQTKNQKIPRIEIRHIENRKEPLFEFKLNSVYSITKALLAEGKITIELRYKSKLVRNWIFEHFKASETIICNGYG